MPPRDKDEETKTPEDVPEGTEPPSGEKTVKSAELFVKSTTAETLLSEQAHYSNKPDFGPDAESKVFKRETESKMLKFKGNKKQFLFNAKIEDRNAFTLALLKKKDYEGAKRGINTERHQPNPE